MVSTVVHGRYVRRIADAPVAGSGVMIELVVRRFRCATRDCVAVTFTEQAAGLTSPHSRYFPLLRRTLAGIGLALAGRAGARLATTLGMACGRDTLLRLVGIGNAPCANTSLFAKTSPASQRRAHSWVLDTCVDRANAATSSTIGANAGQTAAGPTPVIPRSTSSATSSSAASTP
jgi:hypothetical protein